MAKKLITKILKHKPGECPPEVVCVIDAHTGEEVDMSTLVQCPDTIINIDSGCAELTADIEGVGITGDCVNVSLCRIIEIDCVTDAKTITTTILHGNDTDITANSVITECPKYLITSSQEVCVEEETEGVKLTFTDPNGNPVDFNSLNFTAWTFDMTYFGGSSTDTFADLASLLAFVNANDPDGGTWSIVNGEIICTSCSQDVVITTSTPSNSIIACEECLNGFTRKASFVYIPNTVKPTQGLTAGYSGFIYTGTGNIINHDIYMDDVLVASGANPFPYNFGALSNGWHISTIIATTNEGLVTKFERAYLFNSGIVTDMFHVSALDGENPPTVTDCSAPPNSPSFLFYSQNSLTLTNEEWSVNGVVTPHNSAGNTTSTQVQIQPVVGVTTYTSSFSADELPRPIESTTQYEIICN